jgi:hypothetical protein
MPKPTLKPNRTIRSEQVLEAFIGVIRPHLPLDLQNVNPRRCCREALVH